jgi:hypothetical protein
MHDARPVGLGWGWFSSGKVFLFIAFWYVVSTFRAPGVLQSGSQANCYADMNEGGETVAFGQQTGQSTKEGRGAGNSADFIFVRSNHGNLFPRNACCMKRVDSQPGRGNHTVC